MTALPQPPNSDARPTARQFAGSSSCSGQHQVLRGASIASNWHLCTAILTVGVTLSFQVAALGANTQTSTSVSTSEQQTPRAEASIVLIGTRTTPELERLIRELLAQEHIRAEFSLREDFDSVRLFDDDSDARVRVFIEVQPERREARLYFRGSFGKRYLLRSIPLTSGLDDVGNELIAQVVTSSVDALLNGSTGMNREQAKAQLVRERSAVVPATSPSIPPQTAASATYWLHLRYALVQLGPALDWAHGPGVELALGNAMHWRGRVTVEHYFTRELPTSEVAVALDSDALRLSLDWMIPIGGSHYVVPSLGLGTDLTRIRPRRVRSDVRPSESATRFGLSGRPELRYEFLLHSFSFGVAGFVDLALSNIRYELIDGVARTTVATAWRLRPGMTGVAGVRF
ncbi:MAG TPA: hypothetical protein VIV60_13460 [Polyangiaceae bacterium]